jgi:2C-methyl-D-erythritol 2,4-cyclodiphosphate synthase
MQSHIFEISYFASLLDKAENRNNKLNKNEAKLNERNKNLDKKVVELYKCTKALGEKGATLTKLTELLSLQEQRIAHQVDLISKNLESQLRLTSMNAETAIHSEKMGSTDSQSFFVLKSCI